LNAAEEAIQNARNAHHIASLMSVLVLVASLKCQAERPESARVDIRELISLNERHGRLPLYSATCELLSGWAGAIEGRSEAAALISAGLEAYVATGATLFVPCYQRQLAQIHLREGDYSGAGRMIARALETAESTKEHYMIAELYRMKGELAVLSCDFNTAESCFRQAIKIARQQGTVLYELSAATDLAGLLFRRDHRNEALSVLQPAFLKVDESFEHREWLEARKVLSSLAQA
jgi:predicted ATPase